MNLSNILRPIIAIASISSVMLLTPVVSQGTTVREITNPRQSNGGWVSDMADVLDRNTENQLNQLITDLESKDGTEIAVVTVNVSDTSPKVLATKLFNYWGVGKANSNNGILYLLSIKDNRLEIETGLGIEDILPDDKVAQIINREIIPYYKENQFDLGTLNGVRALITALETATVEDASIQSESESKKRYGWLLLSGIALGISTGGVVCYRRSRHKVFVKPNHNLSLQKSDNRTVHCAKCRQPLARTKDIELSPAQQVAQKLGGVSYRGYQCPQCSQDNSSSIVAYFSKSDRFDDCPHCQELTMIGSTQILEKATYEHSGKALIVQTCQCCNYQTEDITNIPRLVRDRNRIHPSNNATNYAHSYNSYGGYGGYGGGAGGGGSFGGGSSDGGGAGGSW